MRHDERRIILVDGPDFLFQGGRGCLSACMECDEGVPLKLFEDSKTEA